MLTEAQVFPAYGKVYKSGKEAKAAFLAGADFKLAMLNRYCSVRDFISPAAVEIYQGERLLIRFKF